MATTHRVSYLPNASVLQFLRHPRSGPASKSWSILAVGNPANMHLPDALADDRAEARLPSLPTAAAEAVGVADLFERSTLLLGEQASRTAIDRGMAGHDVLHFATHGKHSSEAPLSSAVLLAHGAALAVHDLMELRLEAELVAFSACETSGAEATAGDDVLGLTRGVLAAGARSALVSLLPVADLTTALLIRAFYRGWRAGQPAAAAHQSAQVHVCDLTPSEIHAELDELQTALDRLPASVTPPTAMDEARSAIALAGLAAEALERRGEPRPYAHPYHWAPFILVGAPGPA